MLHLARDLDLPDDAVTQTFAILARRGAGKTYTAKVLAEEMIEAGYPVVILDPVGVWHGLRSNAAGTGAGYPVTILGGEHGDLPLDAHAGVLVANLVASDPVAVVLDLSSFDSKNQQRQFVTDFAERLYRAKSQQSERTPLHLIIDEADEFAPQKSFGTGDARMLGAFETLVRRGRARGIGVTMITQRPAVLNKNLLTQTECLVVMQVTSPQDRKAIGEWVQGNASTEEQKVVDASLASMVQGEAWFWSPAWLQMLRRVKIRKARTFDSSATPKPGEIRREAKVLAPVDLDRLKEGMDRVVKDAERNDPKRLQARVRELERELTKRPTETAVERVEVPVEVPAIDAATLSALGTLLHSQADLLDKVLAGIERVTNRPAPARSALQPAPRAPSPRPVVTREPVTPGEGKFGKAERSILSVLAQFPDGRSLSQIAMLTGYRPTASTIGVALSNLRKLGYVADGNQPARASEEGIAALGNDFEPLPHGAALLDYWKRTHLGKGEVAVLDLLLDAYPNTLDHETICARTGYSPTASTVGVIMSKLRKLELVTGWRASDEFMDAIA